MELLLAYEIEVGCPLWVKRWAGGWRKLAHREKRGGLEAGTTYPLGVGSRLKTELCDTGPEKSHVEGSLVCVSKSLRGKQTVR